MEDDIKPPQSKAAIHHDEVAEIAKGGLIEDMPPSYYYSASFIGTICVSFPRNVCCMKC
jgi:hypothetical protein